MEKGYLIKQVAFLDMEQNVFSIKIRSKERLYIIFDFVKKWNTKKGVGG